MMQSRAVPHLACCVDTSSMIFSSNMHIARHSISSHPSIPRSTTLIKIRIILTLHVPLPCSMTITIRHLICIGYTSPFVWTFQSRCPAFDLRMLHIRLVSPCQGRCPASCKLRMKCLFRPKSLEFLHQVCLYRYRFAPRISQSYTQNTDDEKCIAPTTSQPCIQHACSKDVSPQESSSCIQHAHGALLRCLGSRFACHSTSDLQ